MNPQVIVAQAVPRAWSGLWMECVLGSRSDKASCRQEPDANRRAPSQIVFLDLFHATPEKGGEKPWTNQLDSCGSNLKPSRSRSLLVGLSSRPLNQRQNTYYWKLVGRCEDCRKTTCTKNTGIAPGPP